jgi:hypothetical protein
MKLSELRKAPVRVVERLKQRRAYSKFSRKYGQLGFKPNLFQLIKVMLLTLPKKSDFFDFFTHRQILREWQANRFPEDLRFNDKDLPTIEILIVAAGKDMELLPDVIRGAVASTLNPICGITIVIPLADQKQCEKIIHPEAHASEIKILLEDDVLDESNRSKIKSRFGDRYGWVLQQVLSVEYILNSKAAGVLLLDADTVLIRKVAWVDSSGNQKLLVGFAFHKPFHELLNTLIKTDLEPKTTHVTHHMLIQPEFLREIFKKFSLIDTQNLVDQIVQHANPNEESAISIDFELYAQAIMKLHPEKMELRKFSNVSVARNKDTTFLTLQKEFENYNSVSMHSYLVADA